MWIQTLSRAVSIVAVPNVTVEGQMQIRGRLRSDVEGLVKGAPILRTPDADYRYRIIVHRQVAEEVLLRLLREVEYPNFKNAVHDLHGHTERYQTYSKIHHLIEENLSEPGESWHEDTPPRRRLVTDRWIRTYVHDLRKLRSSESQPVEKLSVRQEKSGKRRKAKRLGGGKGKQTSSK